MAESVASSLLLAQILFYFSVDFINLRVSLGDRVAKQDCDCLVLKFEVWIRDG